MRYSEDKTIEEPIIQWLQKQGWTYKQPHKFTREFTEAVDKPVLLQSIQKLNQNTVKTEDDAQAIIYRLTNLPNNIQGNKEFFTWLRNEGSISLRPDENLKRIVEGSCGFLHSICGYDSK